VVYDFVPTSGWNSLELPLTKGELITVLRKVDANWLEGRKKGRRGIFPASFVQIVDKTDEIRQHKNKAANVKPHSYTPNAFQLHQEQDDVDNVIVDFSSPKRTRFRAIYGYAPLHSDELELRENDLVDVVEKCDDGWFVGTNLRSNKFGTFPGNYVNSL